MKHLKLIKPALPLFILLWVITGFANAQERALSGKITDDLAQPLPGVNIVIQGTSSGTATNAEGEFSLRVKDSDVLVVSFLGFIQETIPVKGQTFIALELKPDNKRLEEVVVTALGIEREKKALGYSVQQIESEEFLEAKEINLLNSL